MNPLQLVEEHIEGKKPSSNKDKLDAQAQLDNEHLLNNSVTQSKLLDLKRIIEETEDVLFIKTLQPESEDREVRVMAIRLSVLKFVFHKLTTTE